MDENKKCNYEAMFIFNDEASFKKHIEECPDCKNEHEKYMKVSALIKEAAPLYFKRQENKKKNALKKLACCLLLFLGLAVSYTGYNTNSDDVYGNVWNDESYISSIGLPIDDYGFLDF